MENLTVQQKKTVSLALENTSQTITAINLSKNDFQAIEKSVGMLVKDLAERPPIQMLTHLEGMKEKAEAFLAVQLVKLSESVNINQNLNIQNYQIPTIAAHLIASYPVESLEDFVLCFRRGGAGFYGTIFKLDASVLCEWMKAYLDEKYTFVESKVKEEKDKGVEENEINYEEFKKRSAEVFKKDTRNNAKENEYQRMKLERPYKYFKVHNLEIYATSQEHAEQLVKLMIERGELEVE